MREHWLGMRYDTILLSKNNHAKESLTLPEPKAQRYEVANA